MAPKLTNNIIQVNRIFVRFIKSYVTITICVSEGAWIGGESIEKHVRHGGSVRNEGKSLSRLLKFVLINVFVLL